MAAIFEDAKSLYNFVVLDGHGVKGIADTGITKVPELYVQSPEERVDDQNAFSDNQLPIDLSGFDGPDHDKVVEQIAQAAKTLGFFQVINHGVPSELLELLKDSAHRFYSQPPEKKAVYLKGSRPNLLSVYGTSFAPDKEKALEWKDRLTMSYTNDAEALQNWPDECKEGALEYLKTCTKMVRKIFNALIAKLGVTLDETRVDAFLGSKVVTMNFYPACPNPELTIGIGRHSDSGTLTVLVQDNIGGLYVKVDDAIANAGNNKEWMAIPPIPGALVINVGDALEVLSNGRYKSAEHRVRAASKKSRVSIPFFTLPVPSAIVEPLPELVEKDGVARYRQFKFEEYTHYKFRKIHEGKVTLYGFATLNHSS